MKRIAWCLILILLLGCLTAVGASAESQPTELSLWVFVPLHVENFQHAVDSWNATYPDRQIKLNAEALPYEDLHSKLLIALQSGTGAPDICDVEISRFANFLKGDIQLVELDEIIARNQEQLIMPRFEIYAKNGHYYGAEVALCPGVMYYNMELVEAAGIDIDAIKTWTDYIEAGKKFVEATGKPWTTIETSDQVSLAVLLSQIGSGYLAEDGTPALDSELNIEVLTMLSDMVNKDKIAIPAPGGGHHSEEYYGFMNASGAASMWMPEWYMSRYLEYMPDLKGKMKVTMLPVFEDKGFKSGVYGGTGTVITKQCKNQELALDFLEHARLTEPSTIAIWEDLAFFPCRKDAWDDPQISKPNKFTEYFLNDDIFGGLKDIRDSLGGVVVDAKYPDASIAITTKVMLQVIEEQGDPAEVLKAANAELLG